MTQQFRKKPVPVEAITFEQLIEHGRASVLAGVDSGSIVNGMPWSFTYKGHPITHENDYCYLIPTANGTAKLLQGDWLCSQMVNGKYDIWPVAGEIFASTYEPADPDLITDECDALRARLAGLLTSTANALKGRPASGAWHSWHDLPELAASIIAERDKQWLQAIRDAEPTPAGRRSDSPEENNG
jgi:hypothetical protein